jgi:predicted RNase H-like nuclease (RuvC/YqgF family)
LESIIKAENNDSQLSEKINGLMKEEAELQDKIKGLQNKEKDLINQINEVMEKHDHLKVDETKEIFQKQKEVEKLK